MPTYKISTLERTYKWHEVKTKFNQKLVHFTKTSHTFSHKLFHHHYSYVYLWLGPFCICINDGWCVVAVVMMLKKGILKIFIFSSSGSTFRVFQLPIRIVVFSAWWGLLMKMMWQRQPKLVRKDYKTHTTCYINQHTTSLMYHNTSWDTRTTQLVT